MARVTISDSTALESEHHSHHFLFFGASHEANTDSRGWRNMVHLLMNGTTVSLGIESWIQRGMIHYFNNLPHRRRGKVSAG